MSGHDANLAQTLHSRLPPEVRDLFTTAQNCLGAGALYLVGGTVRDLLLGVASQDYDLVLEGGNTKAFANDLHKVLDGHLLCHDDFGTCTLELPHLTLDIATARNERYAHPGALPTIKASSIDKDLARRDFSINAMALRLDELALLDPFHGRADLHLKQLRILHSRSFIDDPTRILRGARLAGRLGMTWEKTTKEQIFGALGPNIVSQVSPSRFRSELELTLHEARVTPALAILQECGALEAIFGMNVAPSRTEHLDTLRQTQNVPPESYLFLLLMNLPQGVLQDRLETFGWPLRYAESIQKLRGIEGAGVIQSQHFGKLNEAEKTAVRAFSRDLDERIQDLTLQFTQPRLSGKDVLDLGLKSGPAVGSVLARVAQARDAGKISTFDDELALAAKLVQAEREKELREPQ